MRHTLLCAARERTVCIIFSHSVNATRGRKCTRENSSSPETCNNEVCSTTSPGEMTSVRTCYCKHEKNAARKKDNGITIHTRNRQPATTVSKKSIVTSRICGNGRESCKRARCVSNEGTPNTNRSVEAQPSNPILSPETSIALENAEKIIKNAKIQLMEVCATSSSDSAQRNRNTYSDEPPLDDEAEERMYVRELVATKFHDTCSSRLSETTGKASEHSEKHDSPPVTVRKIDLSAPKFRMSRRRRADWSSLGYGSDDRSRGRASPARVPSRDSMGVANGSTARDDRARDRRRTLSARGNTCGIQKGPSVHIIDRELTRQDLEDVHISPESSRAQSRANVATYTLHHDVIQNANDPEAMPTTRCVRLDTLREKPIGRLIIEATTEMMPTNSASMSEKDLEKFTNSESEQDNGRIESLKRKNPNPDPQNAEGTGTSECLKNATNQEAKCVVIATPRTDRNEKLQNKARNENHEGIASGDTEIRYAQVGGIFSGRSAAGHLRNDENIVDKIQPEEKQGDRSKPSLAGDTSRKTAFPRRENITCREAESLTPYRTIDGHLSHTFNSHNGQDVLCNVAIEDARRTFSLDVSRAEDDLDEADLYRPCLDDLDSILHSNDRKIERVIRTTRNLSALLSGPEFALYKLDEDERVPQHANHEKLCQDSLADKDNKYSLNEPARSSILEIELRNENLTVSEIQRIDKDPKGTNATGAKSAGDHSCSRSNYSKNYSVESSVFPASDASDDPRTSRDSDRAQGSAVKARFADSSVDRSDVTTFSNLVPALSSTHTETQCRLREEEIVSNDCHADAKSRVTSTSKLYKREICRSGKKYVDNGILPQLSQKDAFQATDRFVTYILQDEKQSLEGKVARALKESAITPATVQKLLDHLREAEPGSIRDARQTETLDVLKNILINVKSQSDHGNANDKETSSRNIPDSSTRMKVPSIVIDELTSQEEEAQQTRAKIDTNEIERVNKNSYELKSPGGHSFDFSESRERRESVRSTARCASTQNSENNSKRDAGQTKSAEVPIDAKNQTADKSDNENNPGKKMTLPRNVAGSLIRTDATSNATEKTILQTQTKNNTSDTGLIADKFKDSKRPDKYFSVSPAFPETRESVRSAVHFEFARDSKNNSKNNSKGNSASEGESLKQISDIRSDDDDENPRENLEHLSTKIASAESKQEREIEAADSVTAIAASENKKDNINNEKLGEDKSADANKNQYANKIITQTKQVTESDIPEEAVKEIKSEKIRDIITPVGVLFALSEVSEIKDEQVRSDASPVRSKFIDKVPRKTEVDFVRSSTKEDTGSLHETKINSRQIVVKEKIDPVDNCSDDPPRDCIVKNSESSLQEFPSRNKQNSLDIEKDNSTRNEEISKSMTFAAIENRKDRNESSRLQKSARSDNVRQSIDLTERLRNYKIDVLSSSNSSVNSTLLDERSTNGMSSANARKIGTTPETSHSEGELYMPSSCSYSLGEVRVLRRKRDLIEDNGMDRDSSVTVLVTRSMLTSLNDSTVSLLESSGHV